MKMQLLNELFGDEEIVNKYISIFKEETPVMINSIKTAWYNKNYKDVSIIAHGLKSQLTYLQEDNTLELAKEIESFEVGVKEENRKELKVKIDLLEQRLNGLMSAL